MKKINLITIFFALIFLMCGMHLKAQEKTYIVALKDKDNNTYSIDNPEAFLSEKSINRRLKYNIPIDEYDLPISLLYKNKIKEKGYRITHSIKWLNTLIVKGLKEDSLLNLPFVTSVRQMYSYDKKMKETSDDKFFEETENCCYSRKSSLNILKNTQNVYDYGDATNQIEMLNGNYLHNAGYDGKGITIGVLDSGFESVNEVGVFDNMREEGRLLGTKDIVEGKDLLTQSIHSHGRFVLSCMAANEQGLMVGTAPKANYWLIRTEDAREEYLLEEYFWVDGAEFADSVGVDIINSSLGYTDGFVMSANDHVYADMNGKTAITSIGAGIASDRGILVVNSAGNSGNKPWLFISSPADNEKVLTVGGVTAWGSYAYFSSLGPTADGRIKPDVVAQAEGTTIISSDNMTFQGDGTSFSSPIMAGMAACLWQMFPEKNNMEIRDMIKQFSSLNNHPNNQLGYGIPDFLKIYEQISKEDFEENLVKLYPNPFVNDIVIDLGSYINHFHVALYDCSGKIIMKKSYKYIKELLLNDFQGLSSGIYFLKLSSKHNTIAKKIIKY